MPPHSVQRIAQYSQPRLPPITRRTANSARQSGQRDSMERTRLPRRARRSSRSIRVIVPPLAALAAALSGKTAQPEAVDMLLGVGDGRLRVGPGKAHLERWKQHAVDRERTEVGAPDARVPQAFARLKGFDVKAVVIVAHGC